MSRHSGGATRTRARPTVWRWSHTRRQTDTIIVGRDPEIVNPRPPDFRALFLAAFNLGGGIKTIRHVFIHALGKKTFPEEDFSSA